jgi:SAM-dependent methyltransferase
MPTAESRCQICGHEAFGHVDVLWPELIQAWELQPDEVEYINAQQGTHCVRCNGNLRSQALARALLTVLGWSDTLESYVAATRGEGRRLLEINEAGTLGPWLARFERHQLMRYPEVDMSRLPSPDGAFDLVVHSDTLEHVRHPASALAECARVLDPQGACVFTVPIRVGRLTRSREGLPASYHGNPDCRQADFLVHTEYGSDVWTDVLRAGFASCEMVAYRYPAGIALIGRPRKAIQER